MNKKKLTKAAMSKSHQRKTTKSYQALAPLKNQLKANWKEYTNSPAFGGWQIIPPSLNTKKVVKPVFNEGHPTFKELNTSLIKEYDALADKLEVMKKFMPAFFKKRLIFL